MWGIAVLWPQQCNLFQKLQLRISTKLGYLPPDLSENLFLLPLKKKTHCILLPNIEEGSSLLFKALEVGTRVTGQQVEGNI